MALPSITISTILSDRTLSVHRIRSPSICLTFMKLTSLPFATLGKAALMSMRSTPVMWPFVQAAWALWTMMAMALMADCLFLLPNCLSLCSPRLSALSDNSSVATFSTTFPMQLSRDMERYAFSFVQSALPGLRITTPLDRFHTAGGLPVRIAALVSLTILSLSHFQSSCMAPKDSLFGPSAFLTDYEYKAHTTACSVRRVCVLSAGGSL